MKRIAFWCLAGGLCLLMLVFALVFHARKTAQNAPSQAARAALPGQVSVSRSNAVVSAGSAVQASVQPSSAPAHASTDVMARFTAFAGWADQFLSNSASVSLARGQALAWKRRE